MRGLVLSRSRISPILLVSLLVLSTHLLSAQRTSPPQEIPIQLFDTPAQLTTVSEAPIHLHFTCRRLPTCFEQNQSETESWMRFHPNPISDYRLPINTKAVLDETTRTPELRGKEKYSTGSAPSKWLTFAPTYGKLPHEMIYRVDELEYYAHHIPWAGSFIVRICEQARAHPHVTRALKILRP